MTQQEALAVLYRFWDVYWQQATPIEEQSAQKAARRDVENTAYEALLVLTDSIHGNASPGGSHYLCDACYMRYADGHLYEDIGGLCELCRAARAAQPIPVSEELSV